MADNPPSGFRYLAKCSGHSSTVNHLDWSVDSRVLQSNDQSYELLYWQADRLSPGLGMQLLHDQRDTQWETWSTINGFDVMGNPNPNPNANPDPNTNTNRNRNPNPNPNPNPSLLEDETRAQLGGMSKLGASEFFMASTCTLP